jgi:osmotically-inducible protein OsmY
MSAIILKRTRSDYDIQKSVLDELKWDTRIDETHIRTAVECGVVTLCGSVGSYAEKLAAQEAAQCVSGVREVENIIEVKVPNSQFRIDFHIARAVEQALEWHALVPYKQIRASVARGWVTLEGTVSHRHERRAAEEAVRNLRSVRGVLNRIRVCAPKPLLEDMTHAIEEALGRLCECQDNRVQVEAHDGVIALSGRVHAWPAKAAILAEIDRAPGVEEVEDHLQVAPAA